MTFPVAFSNYEACDPKPGTVVFTPDLTDDGTTNNVKDCTKQANWYNVSLGIPRMGQWVRTPGP